LLKELLIAGNKPKIFAQDETSRKKNLHEQGPML
jgi:hypothetical protein